MLSVRELTKSYGKHVVLDQVSLDVAAGQAVILTGPNGSGKSTLLRCVVGAEEPTSGTVTLNGADLDDNSPQVRANLAVVMDDLDFFPDLSVVEHLDLFARAHHTPDAEALVDEVLNDVGLIAQSGQLPGTLSSGQRRRMALASAFVRPRKALILDEPEARLDAAGLEWLIARLAREKREGLAVLLASHSPALVEAIADTEVSLGRAATS